MKQRRTQQNRQKRPTSRARSTPDTIDGVRRTGTNGGANRGANQGKSRASGHAVPVAQAAQMLGVDASTIKRMGASGRLHSFKTTGGHWRIALADIEAVQRGDGNGDNMRRPTTSSPLVQHRREGLEEMRLLVDEKKARVALEELEEQERQRKEQKEAARRAAENEARRVRRERDAEQARRDREREEREQQREEFERRQNWVDAQVEFA